MTDATALTLRSGKSYRSTEKWPAQHDESGKVAKATVAQVSKVPSIAEEDPVEKKDQEVVVSVGQNFTTVGSNEEDQTTTSDETSSSNRLPPIPSTLGQAVFTTGELVDMILCKSTPHDALRSLRINHTTSGSIVNCTELKRKTWVLPTTSSTGASDEATPSFGEYIKALLDINHPTFGLKRLNNMLASVTGSDRVPLQSFVAGRHSLTEVAIMVGANDNPHASYRRMLLTDPPVDRVVLYDYTTVGCGATRVSNTDGVTMGDVLDQLAANQANPGLGKPTAQRAIIRFCERVALDETEEEKESLKAEDGKDKDRTEGETGFTYGYKVADPNDGDQVQEEVKAKANEIDGEQETGEKGDGESYD